jgi:membrane fusion protein (multidrug efflux system)
MKTADDMNTATLDRPDALSLRSVTPVRAPRPQPLIEPEETVQAEPNSNDGRAAKPAAPKQNKRGRKIVAGIAAVAASLATGIYYARFVAPFESTDDAFIEAHVTPISPQVAGRVERLLARDNQEVRRGDLLLEIDPRDYQAKLDQALANLAAAKSRLEQANAQFEVDQAKIAQEKANVVAVGAESKRAAADFKRYQAVGTRGVSESQLDLAGTQARSASAEVDVALNKQVAAEAQAGLDKANIATSAAEVRRNEAAVRQAELDLSYTRVTAQESGYVTRRAVEQGSYVQTGQSLLAIVPREVWVVANFKETQLTRMRAGQPVEVKVDAYPGLTLKGHVDSIQAGAGARFSLLPPENASGNYVKVVQRVPVKIELDDAAAARRLLGPGMSVTPEVRIN